MHDPARATWARRHSRVRLGLTTWPEPPAAPANRDDPLGDVLRMWSELFGLARRPR